MKKIEVITRDCNGEIIILMRRKVVFASWLTLGLYRPWRDYRCENTKQFLLSQRLHDLKGDAEGLILDYLEEKRYIKNLQAEVSRDTSRTKGLSAPYIITVPNKQAPFDKQKFIDNPGEDWSKIFNPTFLKSLGYTVNGRDGSADTLREKVGASPIKAGVRAQVTHKELPKPVSIQAGKPDINMEIEYSAPPPPSNKGNKNRKGNGFNHHQQQQQQQHDNNHDQEGTEN